MYIYDIQLHFQNFTRANNNRMAGCIWPVGRSVGTPGVEKAKENTIQNCQKIHQRRKTVSVSQFNH